MIKKNILIGLLLCCSAVFVNTSYAQQESQFTQYMYNTGTINPAYVGTRGSFEATALYRSQWVGLDGAPRTFNLTGNSPIGERIGVGISFTQDNITPSEESTIAADFSYTIPMNNNNLNLSFGLKGGINLLNIDYTLIDADPDFAFENNIDNRLTPIIGAGIYVFNDKWYAGLSVPSILETTHYDYSTESNASEKAHFYAIGGYVFNLSDSVKFKPSLLWRYTANAPTEIDISANFLFIEKFTVGAAYRVNADISALVGFQISDTLLVGYSYDYATTNLGSYNSGSHEIFLRFKIFEDASRCKCISPRFF